MCLAPCNLQPRQLLACSRCFHTSALAPLLAVPSTHLERMGSFGRNGSPWGVGSHFFHGAGHPSPVEVTARSPPPPPPWSHHKVLSPLKSLCLGGHSPLACLPFTCMSVPHVPKGEALVKLYIPGTLSECSSSTLVSSLGKKRFSVALLGSNTQMCCC